MPNVTYMCISVSDGSSHGFDLSDFPMLSLAGRSRQDSSGGLVPSSAALPQRSGCGTDIPSGIIA